MSRTLQIKRREECEELEKRIAESRDGNVERPHWPRRRIRFRWMQTTYSALWEYAHKSGKESFQLTFEEIREIAGNAFISEAYPAQSLSKARSMVRIFIIFLINAQTSALNCGCLGMLLTEI